MKIVNQKLSVIAAAIAMTSSAAHAEINLGKGLSVSGFIDMSFAYTDVDGATSTDRVFAVDQVETTFSYAGSDGISAQVDIEYGESSADSNTDDTFVEQAIIKKQINDQFSVKAGRFLSYSGWETEEPTGLFQYSGTGYAPVFYGFYQQGISAYYDAGMVDIALSVVNDVFANPIENDTTQLGTELMLAITPMEGVTAKAFFMQEGDKDAINFWTSYSVDAFTFALEYNTAEDTAFVGSEADGYLLMANYAVGDYGLTLRYHDFEIENAAGTTVTEASAFTIAPSMTLGENLLLVAEYRMDSDDLTNIDADTFALEALFTF
ncbi:MAG: porin [Pseudomonadales bacterium]|nr:porin [Gammaproteobacteria bacterium]NNL57280.1 porin [Pseudomonadales bacterium]